MITVFLVPVTWLAVALCNRTRLTHTISSTPAQIVGTSGRAGLEQKVHMYIVLMYSANILVLSNVCIKITEQTQPRKAAAAYD